MSLALLTELREATHAGHENLHVHPALKDLTSPQLSEAVYQHALIKFYGFYKPLEDLFSASDLKVLEAYQDKMMITNLVSDLTLMGIDPEKIPLRPLSIDRLTLEQGVAYLYLREGSSLGGQVISKHLARHLEKHPGIENKYFYGRGDQTGPAWKNTVALFQDIEHNINIHETALFAAGLFSQLDEWLSLEINNG